MGWFSPLYSKHYNDAHSYDEKCFNSEFFRKIYDKSPGGARIGLLPVAIVWSGVKTFLSPLVDLVCAVIFPIMFVKHVDRSYFWSAVNAIGNLAFIGTLVTLTVLSIGTSWQGVMLNLTISFGVCLIVPPLIKNCYLTLRGPLKRGDRHGPITTFFKKFKFSQIVDVAPELYEIYKNSDSLGAFVNAGGLEDLFGGGRV